MNNNLICDCPLCYGFHRSLDLCNKIKDFLRKKIDKKQKYALK